MSVDRTALIKKLTDANGLPGDEGEIRNIIRTELEGHTDSIITDRLGNLIVTKNSGRPGLHIGLSAHMDEVGMAVLRINEAGLLTIGTFGVDPRLLPSKIVSIGKDKVKGVIGTKPVHMTKPDERERAIDLDALYIDIGASTKEEAEKSVSLGDFVYFDSEFVEFGERKIKAKALDDRLGCAVMIEILKSDVKTPITAIFCSQEEVGLRGSAVAANRAHVDVYINLEGTVSADMPSTDAHERVTVLGKGPALSLIDRTSVYLKEYINKIVAAAEENGIPYQYRATGAGGTDAANYHVAHGGTPVIGLATPCRYLHSPVSVCDLRDYENTVKLVRAFIQKYGNSARAES
ncbi:MAG: M42 family metallopeptidase [Defluviitaleaceae bacterium]|nr:M42 family metallopeptidase [Defluviitaleaceae bacterium]MCL2835414.1 M42 family metallopeptidase [Defluviitaleaceae bacterium]